MISAQCTSFEGPCDGFWYVSCLTLYVMHYVRGFCTKEKPFMSVQVHQTSQPYLVGVTEFTNLAGNEVSLVILHVNGIQVLL